MSELETIAKILHRLERTKKFKECGFVLTRRKSCGNSTVIEIDDNRNPGHSFELSFDSSGKLNYLDFGF
jgi:hypothetical protein